MRILVLLVAIFMAQCKSMEVRPALAKDICDKIGKMQDADFERFFGGPKYYDSTQIFWVVNNGSEVPWKEKYLREGLNFSPGKESGEEFIAKYKETCGVEITLYDIYTKYAKSQKELTEPFDQEIAKINSKMDSIKSSIGEEYLIDRYTIDGHIVGKIIEGNATVAGGYSFGKDYTNALDLLANCYKNIKISIPFEKSEILGYNRIVIVGAFLKQEKGGVYYFVRDLKFPKEIQLKMDEYETLSERKKELEQKIRAIKH